MASGTELTSNSYLQHHLQNLVLGKLPEGYERADGHVLEQATWTLAHSPKEALDMGFWSFNVDTLGWSIFLGMVTFRPRRSVMVLVDVSARHTEVPEMKRKPKYMLI